MIKKAIIPIAGLGTRLLPLSRVVPKEILPLADKPAVQYLLEEARASGIEEVVFVISPGKRQEIMDYFRKSPKLEKILKERKKEQILAELKQVEELASHLSFSFVVQKEQLGDGHAILQAKKFIKEPVAVFFADDILDHKAPCLSQLLRVFKTCQKPIIALKKVPKEEIHHYGIAGVERIASRLYKIKKVTEKPQPESAPSDLAVFGRYIITPEVLGYLQKTPPNKKREIILAEALEKMVKEGKVVYGHEIEGEWLSCGDKLRWLQANLYFSLKHPVFGPELKKSLKK